jgi:hypothetical protein
MYNWGCHFWLRLQKYWELGSDESKLAFCWATTCLLFFEIYKVTHWCARSVAFSKRAAYNGPRLVFQRWNLTVSYRKGTSVCHLRTRRWNLCWLGGIYAGWVESMLVIVLVFCLVFCCCCFIWFWSILDWTFGFSCYTLSQV